MSDSLKKLRKLTDSLTSWGPTTEYELGLNEFGYATYKTKGVPWQVKNLLNTDGIAVADCISPTGLIFDLHKHPEAEWFFVYQGSLIVVFPCATRTLKAGDYLYIEPNRPHAVEYLEDSRVVAITIPASEDFPT